MKADQTTNALAREQALQSVANLSVQPTSLVEYQSRGRVLVIGDESAMLYAPRLREAGLHPLVLLTHGAVEPGEIVIPLGGRGIVLDGHMGAFQIRLGEQGSAHYEQIQADLVLDLQERALLQMATQPIGYISISAESEEQLQSAVDQLSDLIGTFEKPKFFDFNPSICAHGPAGQNGCTRCLDSCPTQAIQSLGDAIEINPYWCQGGGVCASVCPTGAIRYLYPSAADTLDRIRKLIKAYRVAGGTRPVLVLVAEADQSVIGDWPAHWLPMILEELASVGMDVWLSALAYGAEAVLLVDGGSVPDQVRQALYEQLDCSQQILRGMGYDADVVRYLDSTALAQSTEVDSHLTEIKPATYAGNSAKREAMFSAIDYLISQASMDVSEIPLPSGSPFGAIQVDKQTCTLCMACTSVCPAQALSAGGDVPKLNFYESNCVQCGLCQSVCPEDAITLQPRLVVDKKQRTIARTLNEDRALCCISCGVPFATQSLINSISRKLAGNPMFLTEQSMRRLHMCEDCRVVDAMEDQVLMEATQAHSAPVTVSKMQTEETK